MRVVHCKREPYDVYIGRPGPYGNVYSHIPGKAEHLTSSREEAIALFERDLREAFLASPETVREYLRPVVGKVLGCWCTPKACHGDVLVRLCAEFEVT